MPDLWTLTMRGVQLASCLRTSSDRPNAETALERAPQRFAVGRPEDAALGDDAGDEAMRRDVERRIPDERAGRRELAAADVRHFARVALLDRNVLAVRRVEVDGRQRRRRRRTGSCARARARRRCRCRSCWRYRRWRRCDRRRRRRGRCRPCRISAPAMLSVMTVVWMPSRTSSHAVSRAPWRNGRVSSANTVTCLPCSTAPRMTPSAVP